VEVRFDISVIKELIDSSGEHYSSQTWAPWHCTRLSGQIIS